MLLNQAKSLGLKLRSGGNDEEVVLLFFIKFVCASSTGPPGAGWSQEASTVQGRLVFLLPFLFITIFETYQEILRKILIKTQDRLSHFDQRPVFQLVLLLTFFLI